MFFDLFTDSMANFIIGPIYMFFLWMFPLCLVVAIPIALTRVRILLYVIITLGLIVAAALLAFGLTTPYAGMGYFFVMPFLGPGILAGIVALLIGRRGTRQQYILRAGLSCLIIFTPYAVGLGMDTFAKAETAKKEIQEEADAEEQVELEPFLREKTIPVKLGEHILFLPMKSDRITTRIKNVRVDFKTISRQSEYQKIKEFVARAEAVSGPLEIEALYFSSSKMSEDCRTKDYKNPEFWCDFIPKTKHISFSKSRFLNQNKTENSYIADGEGDENGLIHLQREASRGAYLFLPRSVAVDALGNPLSISCERSYASEETYMGRCSFTIRVSESVRVSYRDMYLSKDKLVPTMLRLKDEASYIFAELQKEP